MNYTIYLPDSLEEDNSFIHPTAIIYPGVTLGNNIYIGAYSVIGGAPEHRSYWNGEYKSVVIGDNVRISNHVTIDSGTLQDTVIGDDSILLAKSHVGHDAQVENNVTISCGALVGGHAVIGHHSNLGLSSCIHQRVVVPPYVMVGMGGIVTKKSLLQPNRKYVGNPVRDIGENIKTS